MPRYNFHCETCGHNREIKLTFSEYDAIKNNVMCECGQPLTRTIEAPTFILNGSGWYKDSYSQYGSQRELDKELKKYDETKNKNERGIYDREI